MISALAVGLLAGAGVVLVVTGMVPTPTPLAAELAALHRRRTIVRSEDTLRPRTRRVRLLGEPMASTSLAKDLASKYAADLRITDTTWAEHLGERASLGLCGLVWAPATSSVLLLLGIDLGIGVPLWVSLVLAPLGFFYPSLALRTRAAERRRSLRHALSGFLDVVSISLAGGRGVDTALRDGATSGQGWAFDALRGALLEAQLLGETPWSGLARLGTDLGVPELGELAASAALAGSEGARVRVSLAAKARSLRLRGLTDVESAAQSSSELMSVPVVLLMVGFVVFLGYPAIVRVLQGI